MNTLYDILKKDGKVAEDVCPKTGKRHEYYEYSTYGLDDKLFQILRCRKCKHESIGWTYR